MRPRFGDHKRALVLGFYQDRGAVRPVTTALRHQRVDRILVASVTQAGRLRFERGWDRPFWPRLAGLATGLAAGFSAHFLGAGVQDAWLSVLGTGVVGFAAGYGLARLIGVASAREILGRTRHWIQRGETLVLVEARPDYAALVAETLTEVGRERPPVFVVHPPMDYGAWEPVTRATVAFPEDAASLRAEELALRFRQVRKGPSRHSVHPRLDRCEQIIDRIQSRLAGAIRLEQGVALSAEWLIDNAYIIQGHIEEFRANLPAGFYRELPCLVSGDLAGYPRAYAIACSLVSDWDARLTRESIESFLQTFQSQTILTSGELWALPMMLRLRLIEYLASLSIAVARPQSESEEAALWANRLLYAARRESERLPAMLAAMSEAIPSPSAHFVAELIGNLYDEEAALRLARAWLETRFPAPLEEVIRQDQRSEAADHVSLANAISSLRLLSQMDWRVLFEDVSHLEAILWTDPSLVYGSMDFGTKDRYRHIVEEIAHRARTTEEAVDTAAVDIARSTQGDPDRHVGYYLIDEGRAELERRMGAGPSIRRKARRWIARNAAFVYLGPIIIATAAVIGVGFAVSGVSSVGPAGSALLGVLLLLPASELALHFVDFLVTRLLSPHPLPKMSFEGGIPDEFRTLVVVPMMLLTSESIRIEVERLEIRALANPDPNLLYCLLADYADAPNERMPEDLEMLEIAVQAIHELNHRHPPTTFLLFHRERRWSDCEGCWIGWERKRGKIESLNRFLTGDSSSDLGLLVGAEALQAPPAVRFVLTLDSDTQLPRDTARKLVATLAHPLNRPHLSPDGKSVLRGYTIIQPRVSTSLPSATEFLFTRLFTDPTGMDPYTRAVSHVYQDLSGTASYHGKGIYDLAAFCSALCARFPDSRILSHDLLEGAHVRVGLASDIELLDLFPPNYEHYCARLHRWIRGDWQIADWLWPRVPSKEAGRQRNPLPAMERWKIFDNLRRSLVPPSVVAMLLVGCLISNAAVLCASVAGALLVAPALFELLGRVTRPWKLDPIVWREPLQNIMRSLLFMAVLPHQAAVSLDAIVRATYRRRSGKLLLEWSTARAAGRGHAADPARRMLLKMAWVPVFSLATVLAMAWFHPDVFAIILPFGLLWAASPLLILVMDRPLAPRTERGLSPSDRAALRRLARQTWRYFDDFVGPSTHWLPPDNYQDAPRAELAERTSPTNIGLYLLSTLAAHDLGYATPNQVIERVVSTLRTLGKMEHCRGHLFNWYDTTTLAPLGERYVSTVDSANLMGCLWTLRKGLEDLLDEPLISARAFRGLSDTFALFRRASEKSPMAARSGVVAAKIGKLLDVHPERLEDAAQRLRELAPLADELATGFAEIARSPSRASYWAGRLRCDATAWRDTTDQYLLWVEVLASAPEGGILGLGPSAHGHRRQALLHCPSLRSMAAGGIPGLSELLDVGRREALRDPSDELRTWLDRLQSEVEKARSLAQKAVARVESALASVEKTDRKMAMGFLFDKERRLFAVGYNAADQRLDRSYYDLLASEARLGSFLAIARGDAPTEHWWILGRPFGRTHLRSLLLSWSGTMFEYLLPLLLTRSYPNSLLDQACRNALTSQIAFARRRGIPWGISESAFSALDARHVYQYKAFGVPELALRHSPIAELVVAPYATALALTLSPRAAVKNLRRLGGLGKPRLRGDYGFYDAIDYSRERGPLGEPGVVVQALMAHHQGMVRVASDNALTGQAMQDRFHADPRVQATLPLLYERVPVAPPVVRSYARDAPVRRLAPVAAVPTHGRLETPDTATPRTQLLSNGVYQLVVTSAGGGYSRWRGFDLTRWRADTTADPWGSFCYFKDLDSGTVWSAPHQPLCVPSKGYSADFTTEKATFRRHDQGIDTRIEIAVSPEDDAEIRLATLINRTLKTRRIEITSYCELALAPHLTDRSHPAFNKLFVQTDVLRDLNALLAWRRPRSPEDPPVWAAQVFATESRDYDPAQFETDRSKFIGRGRDVRNPLALERELSGSSGYVLDPIFSIRRSITLRPGERVQVALVTLASDSREKAVELAAKYGDVGSAHRAFRLAWTHAQLELRHLRIKPIEAQLYQQLAGHVIYPHLHMRASAERMASNVLGQSRLWAHGISGDLPIVAITIEEAEHLDAVQELLVAHDYWRVRGLTCDLVILNGEAEGYEHPLQTDIERLIGARAQHTGVDVPGGVFLRRVGQMNPEEATLMIASACMVIVAARGSLSQQIGSPAQRPALPSGTRHRPTFDEEPSVPLPFAELDHFNGTGGFTRDGREYAIHVEGDPHTPLPWSNVMANPSFGTLVSDDGPGFTWYGNSQAFRLTPWSNDPISNPAGDAIYIYDPDLDALWTPTPAPIRERDAYRARHGQGYTVFEHNSHAIEQEMAVFVPVDDDGGAPVRIQRLRLTNRSSRPRTLRVTSYAEWVLGTDREHTQSHVVTSWDLETQSMFARNAFSDEYGACIAFAACSQKPVSFTGDRTEVLGRNGSPRVPAGLRKAALSNRAGAGLDPCSALQVEVDIEPGDTAEVVFLLGLGQSAEDARDLIRRFGKRGQAERALRSTREYWDRLLGSVQVETPEPEVDLLFNRWLQYQTLSCRIWGRSGFYQSGGAYGFRDQLQDSMALNYTAPHIAREHILRSAARQFVEGDVQHWWHPQSGAGIRTRASDDLLWLPYVTAQYVRVTGDAAILRERVPFLEGRPLEPGEQEAFFVPGLASEEADLLEHCRRAVSKGVTAGPRGLPLIGSGDWNDGLNRVGVGGKGESVWLAWFAVHVLGDLAELAEASGNAEEAEGCRARAKGLAETVESTAWDGAWYRRAFFDDGAPLGSKDCPEAQIDSLPQSWAVISGAGAPERARKAMASVNERLVREESGLVLLFEPPFDHSPQEPGYIKGYPPGVRENGGQYTHGALWVAMAWARLREGAEAVRLLRMLNPLSHTNTAEGVARYRVEPYVVAADVYALEDRVGMGGWTWYTGSAAWMYRVWLEEVLGFKLRGANLTIEPVVPPDWKGFKVRFRFGSAVYHFDVQSPDGRGKEQGEVKMDGIPLPPGPIPLKDDGAEHDVRIVLGARPTVQCQ